MLKVLTLVISQLFFCSSSLGSLFCFLNNSMRFLFLVPLRHFLVLLGHVIMCLVRVVNAVWAFVDVVDAFEYCDVLLEVLVL